MEALCIRQIEPCTLKGASELLDVSWEILQGVEVRAVKRGLERRGDDLPRQLGLDEKQVFARDKYFTIVTNLAGGCVHDVMDKRSIGEIAPWFAEHGEKLSAVTLAAMDMSAGYASLAAKFIP